MFHHFIKKQYPYSKLDLQIIWNKQELPEVVERALLPITEAVYDAITSDKRPVENVTQWCKKANCWEIIREIELDLPDDIKSVLIPNDTDKKKERVAKKIKN